MSDLVAETALDRAFAVRWYQSWIDAWNSHDPERVEAIVTDDFVLDSAIGEIWIRSEQNLVGYWNQPEETAKAVTRNGWLRSGDLGRLDAVGRIHLVDRVKDLIITGGENVYPAEVENVLAAHPAVAEIAVIGVPDERWGEAVTAIAVPRGELDPADLIAFARARMTHFKCPRTVDVVAAIPRTATGKVIKGQLREPYWRGHDRRIH